MASHIQQNINSLLSQSSRLSFGTKVIGDLGEVKEKLFNPTEEEIEQSEVLYEQGRKQHLKDFAKETAESDLLIKGSHGLDKGVGYKEKGHYFYESGSKEEQLAKRSEDILKNLTGKERSIAEGQQKVRQFMDNQVFMEELRARAEKAGFGQRQTRIFEKQAKRLEEVGN